MTRLQNRTYNWASTASIPELERRALREPIVQQLLDGGSVIIYGGHGMGKSYLIRQLKRDLTAYSHVHVVDLRPSAKQTAEAFVGQLADKLQIALDPASAGTSEITILRRWLAAHPLKHLVLLFDEADGYLRDPLIGKGFFNAIESTRRNDADLRMGLLVAGGLGLIEVARDLASPLSQFAKRVFAPRFSQAEVAELAQLGGLTVKQETFDTLHLYSGGVPALSIRGLRELALAGEAASSVVAAAERLATLFGNLRSARASAGPIQPANFVQSVWTSLGEGQASDLPARIWRILRSTPTVETQRQLAARLDGRAQPSEIDSALHLLEAAGLLEVIETINGGMLRLVPSILSLPDPAQAAQQSTLRDQLRADLIAALRYIRRWGSTSFLRDKALMPEAVFQTAILITLASRGWTHVTQESEQGAGRVDVRASHPYFPDEGHVIVEVKRWPSNDYKEIQAQVESYRDDETGALATVMISMKQDLDAAEFNQTCFGGEATEAAFDALGPLILLERSTQRPDDAPMPIDHFLLKLVRR